MIDERRDNMMITERRQETCTYPGLNKPSLHISVRSGSILYRDGSNRGKLDKTSSLKLDIPRLVANAIMIGDDKKT
jgi:hypothetical protein